MNIEIVDSEIPWSSGDSKKASEMLLEFFERREIDFSGSVEVKPHEKIRARGATHGVMLGTPVGPTSPYGIFFKIQPGDNHTRRECVVNFPPELIKAVLGENFDEEHSSDKQIELVYKELKKKPKSRRKRERAKKVVKKIETKLLGSKVEPEKDESELESALAGLAIEGDDAASLVDEPLESAEQEEPEVLDEVDERSLRGVSFDREHVLLLLDCVASYQLKERAALISTSVARKLTREAKLVSDEVSEKSIAKVLSSFSSWPIKTSDRRECHGTLASLKRYGRTTHWSITSKGLDLLTSSGLLSETDAEEVDGIIAHEEDRIRAFPGTTGTIEALREGLLAQVEQRESKRIRFQETLSAVREEIEVLNKTRKEVEGSLSRLNDFPEAVREPMKEAIDGQLSLLSKQFEEKSARASKLKESISSIEMVIEAIRRAHDAIAPKK